MSPLPADAPPHDGESSTTAIPIDRGMYLCLGAFSAVAWAFALELNVAVYYSFKRRRGLYFWSILASSWGCMLHALGFFLKFPDFAPTYVCDVIITVGWWAMVTGQAVVLYSRLHLVCKRKFLLDAVKWMIVWNAVTLHLPTTVLTFGSDSPLWPQFNPGFQVMERIQMTVFCLQEFAISSVYVWATVKLLRPVYRQRTRNVMLQLIWINALIIAMDVVLLAMEYGGNYYIEATLKPAVYAVKLKLEFVVLNQLVRLANSSQNQALLSDDRPPAARGGGHQRRPSTKRKFLHSVFPGRNATVDEDLPPGAGGGHPRKASEASLTTEASPPPPPSSAGKHHLLSPPIKAEVMAVANTVAAPPPPHGISVTTELTSHKSPAPPQRRTSHARALPPPPPPPPMSPNADVPPLTADDMRAGARDRSSSPTLGSRATDWEPKDLESGGGEGAWEAPGRRWRDTYTMAPRPGVQMPLLKIQRESGAPESRDVEKGEGAEGGPRMSRYLEMEGCSPLGGSRERESHGWN